MAHLLRVSKSTLHGKIALRQKKTEPSMETIRRLCAAAAFGLAGCALPGAPLNLADGSAARQVVCSGPTWNWSACVEKASAQCAASGYTIVAQKEEWATAAPGTDNGGYDAVKTPGVARSLVIQCNKAAT
jgi:hypothetical protein